MRYSYLLEYADLFARVLSIGYEKEYTTSSIERLISYSPYFQAIEKDQLGFAPIITDVALIRALFPDLNINLTNRPIYIQCMWAAESYLRIQGETGLTFECIFLYIPLNKMYSYFPIYHEMDFSHIVNEFKRLYQEQSALSIIMDKYGYSIEEFADRTKISYETLYSLKKRRRDIKKISVAVASVLSYALHVRLETVCELKIQNKVET